MANEQIKLSEQDDKELNSFLSEMIDAGASDTDIESFTTDFVKKKSQAKAPTTPSESQTADGGANLLGRAMQGVGQQLQPTETSGTKKLIEKSGITYEDKERLPETESQKVDENLRLSKEREIDNFGKAPLMSDLQDMAVQTSKVPIANQQEMRDRGTHAAINLPKAPLMGDLNDITRSATGATQAGQYQVDGVSVRPDQLNKMLFDDEFVDKLQNGQTEVIVPKEDESLNLLIERQKNAGTRVGDAWNSLKAGATDLAAGLVGIESYAANLMRTIPGFEDMKKSPSEFVAEVGADKLKDMAVKERDKIRAYEGGFIDEVKNGNIGNASSMTANMFAESLAYMASIAATQGAGLIPSLGTLAAVGASSEFAGSDDLDLTNRQKIARATAYGAAESAFSTMPTFGVFSKNFNIAKGLLRGAVKETAKQAGEGAAKQMAKELAEKTAAQGLKEIGIDMGKEVGGEMLTTLSQMGVDDYLGVQDYTAEDYKKQLLETGALTLAMGVGMTSPSQIKVVKKLIDSSIKEDKGVTIKSAISDAVMKGAVDAAQGERLASAIQPRIDAINNLPPEVVNDVDMVDKVANISALELKLKEADDMAKPFIEAELNEARKQVPIPFPNKYVDSGGKNTSELKDGQLYISFDGEVKKWDATKEEFVKQPKPKKEKNDIDSFVNRMKSGEKFTEAEDLQFYENNKDEIESKLKADTEVKVDEVAPEVVEGADALSSVESTAKALEEGNKIQWNVFGNEESGEWTVGEKTKTRGGKDAVVLRKVYVEASSDGKSYTKEYADANGIKYDNERTVEHIVPLEDLKSESLSKEQTPPALNDIESRKQKQLEIINKENPAPNDYNTWVRKVEDIKTAEEAFSTAKQEGAMYPDFTENDMQDALNSGEVTIYSSYPIKEGVFVSPSKMNAQEYAGGKGGKLFSKKIKLNDVAWIDEGEGQYAPVKSESLLSKEQTKTASEVESTAKKTNTVNGYEFTKTPTLDNVIVEPIEKSNNAIIEKQMFADENKNVLANGVKYIGGGWYEIGGDNFGSVDLYNTVTKEGVLLNHKQGGRMGVVVQDFIKNNSRYNDDIAVRGSKYTQEEHNPKFGGSGHYKGTYFYVGLSAESKALEHGKNLTKVDIGKANLYELGEDGQTSQSLKNEAKKAGYDTRDASGYAESEYLKKQGYDGIKRGNEIVLFEPKKFEVKEEIADLPNVSGGTVKQSVPEKGATVAFVSKYNDNPLQMARREKYLDSAVMSNGKQTTERKLIEERVKQGWRVTKITTTDTAASKKLNQEYERLKRTAPIGNENHPETKRLRELEKMPKSLYNEKEIAVKKEELRLESPEGTTIAITPFGEDYVNELLYKSESLLSKEQTPPASSDVEFTAKGGNKVVDEKGNPLVLYHGTSKGLQAEDLKQSGQAGDYGEGIYFATDKREAEQRNAENIIEANVKSDKHLVIGSKEYFDGIYKTLEKKYGSVIPQYAIGAEAKKAGYTSIEVERPEGKWIIAFDGAKIQSIKEQTPAKEEAPASKEQIESTAKLEGYHYTDKDFSEFEQPTETQSLGNGVYFYLNKRSSNKKEVKADLSVKKILDWKNLSEDERNKLAKELESANIPSERLNNGKLVKKEFDSIEEAKKYTNDKKSQGLNVKTDLVDGKYVVEYKEKGLSTASNDVLRGLAAEFDPNIAKRLGYDAAKLGDEIVVFDAKNTKIKSESLLSKEQAPKAENKKADVVGSGVGGDVEQGEIKVVNGRELTFYNIKGRDDGSGFAVEKGSDGYVIQSAMIPMGIQRQGIGTRFYVRMNEESVKNTGNPLRSSDRLSNSAGKPFWENLVKNGYAEKTGDGYIFKSQQTLTEKQKLDREKLASLTGKKMTDAEFLDYEKRVAEKPVKEVPKVETKPEKSVFQLHEETKGASKQDKVLEDYAKANPEKAERVREIIDNFDAMKQRITQLIDEKKITNLKIEC